MTFKTIMVFASDEMNMISQIIHLLFYKTVALVHFWCASDDTICI